MWNFYVLSCQQSPKLKHSPLSLQCFLSGFDHNFLLMKWLSLSQNRPSSRNQPCRLYVKSWLDWKPAAVAFAAVSGALCPPSHPPCNLICCAKNQVSNPTAGLRRWHWLAGSDTCATALSLVQMQSHSAFLQSGSITGVFGDKITASSSLSFSFFLFLPWCQS